MTSSSNSLNSGVDPHVRPTRHVFVRDLELMARVGIYEVEKRYVQRVIVSVDLEVVDDYDGVSDRIGDVVDYGQIVAAIRNIVDSDHFQLIETLAERIAEAALMDRRTISARITVEKPDAVPGCRSVGIAIERQRSAQQS
ncbi:MAG TPA: dihydroneopterin aldolase [Hyphomicrobiaceae bacterium]|nr:dihydroneopterin aldolase [Hyphomicrobiaceae bacterium]